MRLTKLFANGSRLFHFSASANSVLSPGSPNLLSKFLKTNSVMAKPPITIGGKSSSLSSTSLYSISHNFYPTQIDSSSLPILDSFRTPKIPFTVEYPNSSSLKTLPLQLSRAALVVLLNKLLISDYSHKSCLATLVERTLNSRTLDFQTLDFGSSFGFVKSFCEVNGCSAEEIGITKDEAEIIEKCCAGLIGICGVLDCGTSVLIRICDAVAGLSCEAARADAAAAFDLPVSGDGFTDKDKIDVAGELKTLLFGSKLVGNVDALCFSEIPSVHGCFREAVKTIHKKVRVELNASLNVKKKISGSSGIEEGLSNSVLSLASSIRSVGKGSLGRMKIVVESISDSELRSKVVNLLEKECSGVEVEFSSVLGKLVLHTNYIEALCGVYDMYVKLREILAWEAALALFVIENDESIDKGQVGNTVIGKANGENVKNEKKKKKRSLGKGTMTVRQLLKERLKCGDETIFNPTILVDWARELSLYFDPKDAQLDIFLSKLKEIVESNEVRRLPKIPKGTRDFGKEQMAIRERAFAIITSVFKRHGAVALDTPVFELRETLMGKYGEDSKLIYDLADQGGELCSLRYDLTVPFARYLAMNNISSLKRYQIAKVYRRDNPSKGRYREFYQCDLDIAGQYETMEPDFEVVKVLTELLDELQIGDYEVKLNHRKLLDAMLDICGVPSEKFRTVCSSIDKLDKQSFEQIKKELVEEKGLSSETADKIGSLVKKRGAPLEVLLDLKGDGSEFMGNSGSVEALQELEILFKALENAKCVDKIVFDLSLARGLDYYTGVIFEAVFKGATQVGSIAAGGRYDNLVGMFSGKQVPAVGVSLGIERVFTIMEQIEKDRNQLIRATETEVLVAILSKDIPLAAERVSELWDAKIKAEYGCNKRVMNHINRAKQSGIPWMVIIGESELGNGVVKLKNIEENREEEFSRDEIVEELRKRLHIV